MCRRASWHLRQNPPRRKDAGEGSPGPHHGKWHTALPELCMARALDSQDWQLPASKPGRAGQPARWDAGGQRRQQRRQGTPDDVDFTPESAQRLVQRGPRRVALANAAFPLRAVHPLGGVLAQFWVQGEAPGLAGACSGGGRAAEQAVQAGVWAAAPLTQQHGTAAWHTSAGAHSCRESRHDGAGGWAACSGCSAGTLPRTQRLGAAERGSQLGPFPLHSAATGPAQGPAA